MQEPHKNFPHKFDINDSVPLFEDVLIIQAGIFTALVTFFFLAFVATESQFCFEIHIPLNLGKGSHLLDALLNSVYHKHKSSVSMEQNACITSSVCSRVVHIKNAKFLSHNL